MVQLTTYTSGELNLLQTLGAYGFEGLDDTTSQLLCDWSEEFPETWPILAVVEAVHQGRYKVLSIQQILRCWQRRGQPRINFDRNFQRQILEESWEPIVPPIPRAVIIKPEPVPVPTRRWREQPVVHRLRELVGVA
ncbi:hypothetical protein [Candidatus Cyanaurora vandensis]|uniref:hypothetical protein n=1 Tax=Candidatus Cyanaurora vandensis TaxID=2714958 RepID=UPI00257EB526|nr:hypothetical protein [Candidatus Cyanaurora vandensis]